MTVHWAPRPVDWVKYLSLRVTLRRQPQRNRSLGDTTWTFRRWSKRCRPVLMLHMYVRCVVKCSHCMIDWPSIWHLGTKAKPEHRTSSKRMCARCAIDLSLDPICSQGTCDCTPASSRTHAKCVVRYFRDPITCLLINGRIQVKNPTNVLNVRMQHVDAI